MTALVITAPADTTAANFVERAERGEIQFHKERGNGTTRRVHFLTGTAREHAEWAAAQREDGKSMREIATEAHQSVPTIRRWLTDLALTEAVEQADEEELEAMLAGAEELAPEPTEAPLPTTEEEFVERVVEILS
jgi:hypothetical protein